MTSLVRTATRFGCVLTPILSSVAVLTSCSPADHAAGTAFHDSAGVTLAVAEAPSWGPGEGWRVTEEPLLEIGVFEGDEEYLFSDLVGAVRLGDGRIVVGDRDTQDLRFFSPHGDFLFRVGGNGEGPGEFRRLEFVGLMPGDSLVTYDDGLRRIQVFDPAGRFVRSFVIETPRTTAAPDKMVGVVGGSVAAIRFIDYGSGVSEGIHRWPYEILMRLDLASSALDSVRFLPGHETSVEIRGEGRISQGRYIFQKGPEFSANAGRMAVITTDTFAVHILRLDGSTELIVRRPVALEPATPEHRATYIRNNLEIVFPEGSDPNPEDVTNFRRMLENFPVAPTLPLLRSVHLDSEGNVWVEMHHILGTEPRPFHLFAADGTWLGEVAIPRGFDRGHIAYQAPSFQIGSDFILGVWRDELDVQYVRLYGLEKE